MRRLSITRAADYSANPCRWCGVTDTEWTAAGGLVGALCDDHAQRLADSAVTAGWEVWAAFEQRSHGYPFDGTWHTWYAVYRVERSEESLNLLDYSEC